MAKRFKYDLDGDGPYEDDDVCPVGYHKGKKLEDISMSDLGKLRDWVYDKRLNTKYHKLIAYIEDNEDTE